MLLNILLHNIIIVTFTKLFVMRIVASVRSLSSLSSLIFLSFTVFSALISVISVGDKLKNAISEPLANADAPISIIVSKIARITPVVGAIKCTSDRESSMKFR